jgi:hypothetical protein
VPPKLIQPSFHQNPSAPRREGWALASDWISGMEKFVTSDDIITS